MTAAAPWDVHAYHEADGKFPHNPTADQLYTDQKFEAYRALGLTAAANAVALMEQGTGRTEQQPSPLAKSPTSPEDNGNGHRPAILDRVRAGLAALVTPPDPQDRTNDGAIAASGRS
jgi:hypothetical protein